MSEPAEASRPPRQMAAHGLADPALFERLSGLELLRLMLSAQEVPQPHIARTLGFALVEVDSGRAVFEGDTGPHLLNPLGIVHGGFALTLIDSACGCACHTLMPAGVGYTTVETKVNFTRGLPADAGRVRCEGRVINAGRQIVTAEANLRDPQGRLIAHGTSTLMVLPPRG